MFEVFLEPWTKGSANYGPGVSSGPLPAFASCFRDPPTPFVHRLVHGGLPIAAAELSRCKAEMSTTWALPARLAGPTLRPKTERITGAQYSVYLFPAPGLSPWRCHHLAGWPEMNPSRGLHAPKTWPHAPPRYPWGSFSGSIPRPRPPRDADSAAEPRRRQGGVGSAAS